MSAAVDLLKREIKERIDELKPKDVKELYDYVVFLEIKDIIPQIDPSQAYFWTKNWQKMEKEAELNIRSGKTTGPFKSAAELMKQLKK
ncbi:MAG: hypothetical protein QME05_01985 [Candidatus Margulisbacteria bacterium]|nr:hypothetical protein [Candidatus Margulisiibacteriota bacterium]